MEENNITVDKAVQTIKGAILRAQAQASQSSNAIQLSLYYGIGRYVSINLQQAHWGAKALDTISERLQRELPGLRGFSSGNLKKMRIFSMRNGNAFQLVRHWRTNYNSLKIR